MIRYRYQYQQTVSQSQSSTTINNKCSRRFALPVALSVVALMCIQNSFTQWKVLPAEPTQLKPVVHIVKPAVHIVQPAVHVVKPAVHIVYATDKEQLIGMQASINSLLKNSNTTESIVIHIFRLVGNETDEELKDKDLAPLRTHIASTGAALKVHEYQLSEVEPFLNTHFKKIDTKGNLLAPSNYVRFLLSTTLIDIDMCMWVDSDTIIQGDIVTFMANRDVSKAMGAFSRDFSSLRSSWIHKLREKGIDVSPASKPSFNAGIIVINLKLWRENKVHDQILEICNLNRELKLWRKFGSQPPLQLLFSGDRFEHLPNELYSGDLGWKSHRNPDGGMFLHWNGASKPWLSKGKYKQFWENYNSTGAIDNLIR